MSFYYVFCLWSWISMQNDLWRSLTFVTDHLCVFRPLFCFLWCSQEWSTGRQWMLCLYYLIVCIANWLPWYHLRCIPNQLPHFPLHLQPLHFMKSRHAVPQFWTPKWLWLQQVPVVRVTGWVKLCDCSPEMQLASLLDRGQRQGTVKG